MKIVILSSAIMLFGITAIGQENTFDYFGLTGPGDKVDLFAPGIVSFENSNEFSMAISPLGNEVFFSRGKWPESKIMHVKKIGSRWTEPEIAAFSIDCYTAEPAFSPDGKYLYFSSSKGKDEIMEYSIWRMERSDSSWGNAKKIIDIAAPGIWEFHPSITIDGTVYFCRWDSKESKGSIYKSNYLNGVYSEPVKVNIPFIKKNSGIDPFVHPSQKYIIISSKIEDSPNGYDVFISYQKGGVWSEPVKPGRRFSTLTDDASMDVSPDGKFFFIYRQGNVYWTETKGVLK